MIHVGTILDALNDFPSEPDGIPIRLEIVNDPDPSVDIEFLGAHYEDGQLFIQAEVVNEADDEADHPS